MTDWPWPNFTPEEMTCKCGCGRCEVDEDFMDALQTLRTEYGRPMPVTSGYRCPAYNCEVSDTGENGPHTTGRAVDIAVLRGANAYELAYLAMAYDFTGIGLSIKKGQESSFLHIDLVEGPHRLWSY